MNDFPALLSAFAHAVETNDGPGLARLFTHDGTYVDYFFGPYTGDKAIGDMLAHFHEGGRDYRWEFLDPISDGTLGYAHYRFSYVSTLPEAKGRAVIFDGMSCFRFEGGNIQRYSEVFDRGAALAQLDFAPERIKKSLLRWSSKHNAAPDAQGHVTRLKALGASTLG